MKKKILALCLIVALIAIAATGTLAYFTDRDEITNTFTAGNVDIDLSEQDPMDPSKRVDVGADEAALVSYGQLFPGMVITKDPTIDNVGSLEAYVAAKIHVSKAVAVQLLSGGLLGGTGGYELVQVDEADGSVTLYIFINEALQPGHAAVLFDTLTIPAAWDNPEMAAINGLQIHVEAFATQVYGFADCRTAIAAAFASDFAAAL